MRTAKYWLLAALTVSLVGVSVAEEKKEDKKPASIKEVMKKFHGGKKGETLADNFAAGKTTEEETKSVLQAYEDLGKNKPPKGEEDAWKEKTTALLNAAKDIAAKKEGAKDAFSKAIACGACHEAFKPAKPK